MSGQVPAHPSGVVDLSAIGRDPLDRVDVRAAMEFALGMAALSKDPSTQNGAVLIARDGQRCLGHCNEFPAGVETSDERWERPLKYSFIEHAERNVIFAFARHGVPTEGSLLVTVWAPCPDCARAIVQAGVRRLVTLPADGEKDTAEHWRELLEIGATILAEGGVEVVELEPDGLRAPPLRRNGEPWSPGGVV